MLPKHNLFFQELLSLLKSPMILNKNVRPLCNSFFRNKFSLCYSILLPGSLYLLTLQLYLNSDCSNPKLYQSCFRKNNSTQYYKVLMQLLFCNQCSDTIGNSFQSTLLILKVGFSLDK